MPSSCCDTRRWCTTDASPPWSLLGNAKESQSTIFLFREQTMVTLPRDQEVTHP